MKLSKYIECLQSFLRVLGDHECYYAVDDEGNGYQQVNYAGTMFFVDKEELEESPYRLDSVYSSEYVEALEEDQEDLVPIVVIN
jgi:hypothetical protein